MLALFVYSQSNPLQKSYTAGLPAKNKKAKLFLSCWMYVCDCFIVCVLAQSHMSAPFFRSLRSDSNTLLQCGTKSDGSSIFSLLQKWTLSPSLGRPTGSHAHLCSSNEAAPSRLSKPQHKKQIRCLFPSCFQTFRWWRWPRLMRIPRLLIQK